MPERFELHWLHDVGNRRSVHLAAYIGLENLTERQAVLFDDDYKKKPAYYGVLQALKEGR